MSCIHDGNLRQYLDGELAGAELAEVTEHLASCADCRAALEELRAVRAQTEAVLATLAPAADDITIDPALAYAQFTSQFAADREPETWISRLLAPRWRPVWGTGGGRSDCSGFSECQPSSCLGAAGFGHAAGSEDSGGYD